MLSQGFQLNQHITNQVTAIIGEETRLLAIRTDATEKDWNFFVLFFIILMTLILVVLAAVYFIIIKTWKKKEEANQLLESREELLQNIINNSGAAIHVKHLDGRFAMVNKQIETMMGLQKDQLIGKTFYDLFPEEIAKQYTMDELEVIRDHKKKELEQQLMLGNELHTFLSVKFPIFNSEKQLEYIGSISTDITERTKFRDQLAQSNAELKNNMELLETANKEMESFSYSVSHDLRAPLRGIIGYTQILEEDFGTVLNDEMRQVMNTISGSAKKMGQLIDDLLAFSRTGRKEMNKDIINMNELVRNAIQDSEAAYPGSHVKWTVTELPVAHGDLALIKQVWINLLSNGIKYSQKNPQPHVEVGSYIKEEDKSTVYFVKDNGVGFDMKYADKLFQVFQRLHSSSQFEGTGIGLAIVSKIIARHGGKIWAEAEVNNGATFYFSLPAL